MAVLTKAEEAVMNVLWELGDAKLRDIVDKMPEPKPHKNTVATVLKVLLTKGFVSTKGTSRIFLYSPLIKKTEYSRSAIYRVINNYFKGSSKRMVSFLVDERKLTVSDLEMLLKELKKSK
jgi:BlaI family transcriptional regulator, penicillinase repressor